LFTQDVAGATIAADVCYDDWQPATPAQKPVVGVPADEYVSQADDEMVAHFEQRLEDLADAGYEVRRTDVLADSGAVEDRHRDLVAADAALAHADRYAKYGDEYADSTVDLLTHGHEVSVGRLVEARNGRRELRSRLAAAMADTDVDVWAAPAAPGPAPAGIDSTGDPVMNAPWTHAGVPVVALPSGNVDGLPVGLQFAADFGADERLLAWSERLRDVLG
jgi:Asp-tRNA(Asn)/Glu-tRNA(Gln) amidotransferase A subunit family amidase